ncbi:MAG: IS3 family transposase [Candidatus Eremiobacteraeota bacterium]|nr:IS3 family transposase [Candidatus Eremiobacteraeota bacterium]MCD4785309.1 IS3 family transposase [Candidatus Eremiobacteraeota bacterium]
MKAVKEVEGSVAIDFACEALGVARASYYRFLKPPDSPKETRSGHFRALSCEEKKAVLGCLNSERFCDRAPAEVYATLLDEGDYYCSISTMYRILRDSNQVRERRDQLRHPNYRKPELLATGSNQVWSWDITKLLGPAKWTYYHLYVILDIFSRYVVGWMVAHRESAELAKRLIKDTCEKQGIKPGQLTVHADRGSSMKSKTVSQLLMDLGVVRTHSRPHVSNDNPFSESQFKTLKYMPGFPGKFGCIEDSRGFCGNFFNWYNWKHHHSGIGLLTPGSVHYGLAETITAHRQEVLNGAFLTHPERFVRKPPSPPEPPQAVWINPPEKPGKNKFRENHLL